ncbi:MAG: SulP family inorganic anion transporter [Burkholderiaceae bacterium]|nr:SulP family inorganic anion transporter [Burkholderiaceae bacterium]
MRIPLRIDWFAETNRETLRADTIAALIGAAILLPQAMAYAVIAGLPPIYGIYCAIVPTIVAAFLGSSRHLVSGPTAAISIVVFSAVGKLADPHSDQFVTLVLTLTLMVGTFQLAFGVMRLGTLTNFVSDSVIIGFTTGAAALIAASQINALLGLPASGGGNLATLLSNLPERVARANVYAAAIGAATLVIGILSRRYLRRVPYILVALVGGTLLSLAFEYAFGGIEVTGIRTAGAVSSAFPPLSMPSLNLAHWSSLVGSAFAIALLGLTEAVSIARSIALRSGQQIDGDREFVAQGLSNIAGAFFSGYASSGSFTRSGLNYDSGAKTPMGAILASLFVLLIAWTLSPLFTHLPMAAIAGVLMLVAWSLIDLGYIRMRAKASREEALILGVTLVSAVAANLEVAIYVGVLVSLGLYLNRTVKPPLVRAMPASAPGSYHFVRDAHATECPQLAIRYVDGSLFFAAIPHLRRQFSSLREERPEAAHLLLLCSGVNHVDVSASESLAEECRLRRASNGDLYMHFVKDTVHQMMRASGALGAIGEENIYELGAPTIESVVARLDHSICASCRVRAFHCCPPVPTPHAASQPAQIPPAQSSPAT